MHDLGFGFENGLHNWMRFYSVDKGGQFWQAPLLALWLTTSFMQVREG